MNDNEKYKSLTLGDMIDFAERNKNKHPLEWTEEDKLLAKDLNKALEHAVCNFMLSKITPNKDTEH